METSDWISLGAIIVSVIALTASLMAMWKTHYSKFSPVLTVGRCGMRIYPIKNGKKRWFIASFDIPISITNKGAQLGKLEDIRIKISFPELKIKNNYEIFDAKWSVDGKKLSQNRFDWIDKAVIEDWMPIIVLPKETITKHIVFETRWEEPVIQKKVNCSLEIRTDSNKKWKKIIDWNHYLTKRNWVDMAENGRCYLSSPNIDNSKDIKINPKDLHEHTRTEEDFSDVKIDNEPSYLDFNKEKK